MIDKLAGRCAVFASIVLGAVAINFAAPAALPEERWTWGRLPEFDQRRAVDDSANAAIIERDFAALEAMATLYRTGAAPGSGGSSSLPVFYNAVVAELLAEQAEGNCGDGWRDVLGKWNQVVPRSPTATIVEAKLVKERAWCLRGADKAANVKSNAWAPFRAELAKAAELLEANAGRTYGDPESSVVLADIYVDQQRKADFRQLIDAATIRFPTYYGLYYAAYRQAQPQWGGSLAAVDAVARYAAERSAARDGTSAYFRVYWTMVGCRCWSDLAAVDRPTLRAAMRDAADRYPGDWTYLHLVQLSCLLGEREAAQTYFAKLRINDLTAWSRDGWKQCRTLVGPSSLPTPVDKMIDVPWPSIIG